MIFVINHRIHDQQRYNLQTPYEIVAICADEDNEVATCRHIAIYPRHRDLQTISILHSHCDPMIYPLLFPRRDKG